MATHYFPEDRVHFTWDAGAEPVITIADGDTVVINTRDVSDNQIGPDSDSSVIDGLNWDRVYPLAGPIAVEGAKPGHTLVVEILDLRTGGWGWTAILPGLGLLADDFPDAYLRIFTSRPATTRASTTRSRSRSRRSWGRWASARPTPPPRRSCRRGASAGTWTRASSWPARRCSCRWRSRARCSRPATPTAARATARSASPAWRRRCTRRCASRSTRSGSCPRRSTARRPAR